MLFEFIILFSAFNPETFYFMRATDLCTVDEILILMGLTWLINGKIKIQKITSIQLPVH